jgi:hypothetical protein
MENPHQITQEGPSSHMSPAPKTITQHESDDLRVPKASPS